MMRASWRCNEKSGIKRLEDVSTETSASKYQRRMSRYFATTPNTLSRSAHIFVHMPIIVHRHSCHAGGRGPEICWIKPSSELYGHTHTQPWVQPPERGDAPHTPLTHIVFSEFICRFKAHDMPLSYDQQNQTQSSITLH